IISMWSGTDEAGHVGVVESTKHLSEKDGKYSGQITIINENAQGGITPIIVTTNVLSMYGFTKFQWLTGLPTS
ncbi:MAG: hypothetical protein ACRDV8_01450, partial [Acidimicrobiales bacterium]